MGYLFVVAPMDERVRAVTWGLAAIPLSLRGVGSTGLDDRRLLWCKGTTAWQSGFLGGGAGWSCYRMLLAPRGRLAVGGRGIFGGIWLAVNPAPAWIGTGAATGLVSLAHHP